MPRIPSSSEVEAMTVKVLNGPELKIAEKERVEAILQLMSGAELEDYGSVHNSTTFVSGDISLRLDDGSEGTFFDIRGNRFWSREGTWVLSSAKMEQLRALLMQSSVRF